MVRRWTAALAAATALTLSASCVGSRPAGHSPAPPSRAGGSSQPATAPAVISPALPAGPVVQGSPPIMYAVPPGFHLTLSTSDGIALGSGSGAEVIHLLVDT